MSTMKIGADGIGDLAEAREIDDAGIGRAAGDDQLGLVLPRQRCDLVHVDALVLAAHGVGHRLEPFAGLVDGRAVGEMAAGGQIQAHEGVAGLQQREEHRLVGLGAGMRLDIGEGAVEQAAGALDRQLFGDIDDIRSRRSSAGRDSLRHTCW